LILRFFFLKELKRYPFFFLLLFATLLLGTLGLVGISVVSSEVQEKLRQSANELLTSDVAVSARRELSPAEQTALRKVFAAHPHRHYKIIDIYSMVADVRTGASRLVEIRATEDGFPYYGHLETDGARFTRGRLFISKDLRDLWNVGPGVALKVGTVALAVDGVVTRDSSQGLRGFSLAPRIYFPLRRLAETGLLRPGATGSFAYHYKLAAPSAEALREIKKAVYAAIPDSAVKVTFPQDTSDQTARVTNTLTNFMALAALIGLILSLVGVFYLYQSHLLARLKDLCLLNLYGLSKPKLAGGIVAQFTAVFVLVMAVELLLIPPVYRALAPVLSRNLGLDLGPSVNLLGAAREIPFLFALSLFILVPLLLGLLRTPMGLQLKAQKLAMGRFRFFDFLPFVLVLWLFSGYLARSFKTGNIFFGSLCLVFLISTGIVKLGQWPLRVFIRGRGLLTPTIESGVALRGLTRSGHKLTLSFLSLAIGATLISLILQLDKMILTEFAFDAKKPSLFIFDIQEEQMEPFQALAAANGAPLAFVTPMIRARLEAVNGKKFERKKRDFDFRSREEDEDTRLRNNGLNLTFRSYLTDAERIVEGDPFPPGGAPEGRPSFVSIEKRWSERMNVKLGDRLSFDVQGVPFDGVVRNIKEIKWTTFYPNFFVTIEPGQIDAAPKTFLAILPHGPLDVKLSLQRKAVEAFPNISFIDVGELVGKLSVLFQRSRQAIEVISWLSLAVGLVILYGLSHDQVYRRYYDLALMKSLGFSSRQLLLNLLYEFGALFLGAMSLGLFLGWLIAQLIGREVFKLPVSVDWSRVFYPALLLTILCLVTIVLSSWRAVRAKPRELLSDS
jgi:putative ABC transport system permease protein